MLNFFVFKSNEGRKVHKIFLFILLFSLAKGPRFECRAAPPRQLATQVPRWALPLQRTDFTILKSVYLTFIVSTAMNFEISVVWGLFQVPLPTSPGQ